MASQSATERDYYPGDGMDARKTLALAAEFDGASQVLRKAKFWAPYRLAALHAIELYLSAFLRKHGLENEIIRKTGHQFCAKTTLAREHGLLLRAKTQAHLSNLTCKREYLITRYDASMLPTLTELTRIDATLREIATKVTSTVEARSARIQVS